LTIRELVFGPQIMKNTLTIDTYPEYLLFLYIYLANSDYTIQFSEINTIMEKMRVLFPEGKDLEKVFADIKDKFEKLDSYEIEQVIKENYIKFKTKMVNPERFFDDLFDVIVSDGIIQDYEMAAFDKIKKLLQNG
jgi:hypothetical protein